MRREDAVAVLSSLVLQHTMFMSIDERDTAQAILIDALVSVGVTCAEISAGVDYAYLEMVHGVRT